MQIAVKTKKPRKQAVSGRFWAERTYRGRIKDDHKIDPCMGSGHILVYLFDVLMQIYESQGWTQREAAQSIVQNNLYGLDIDERASQLAYFAVMMKARQYDRRFLERGIEPHVYDIRESNGIGSELLDYFAGEGSMEAYYSGRETPKLYSDIATLMKELRDAKEYGSILNVTRVDFPSLYARFDEIKDDISMYVQSALTELLPLVQRAEIMAQKYNVTVTNPPYMGSSNMNSKLSSFCKTYYELSREDLFAVFIEKCNKMLLRHGFQGMITMHSWMFLSSFEKLRKYLLKENIVGLIHFGSRAFDNDVGTIVQSVAFIVKNEENPRYRGMYCDVTAGNTPQQKESLFFAGDKRYCISAKEMLALPSAPIAYWISEGLKKAFLSGERIDKYIDTFQGIITGDNEKFLRYWYEVDINKVSLHATNMDAIDLSKTYWIPYNKGGSTRKWYGIQDYVIDWRNGPDDKTRGRNTFSHFYLREYASWSYTVTDCIPTRFYPCGFLWDVRGSGLMPKGDMLFYLMGLISSRVGIALFKINNSTLSCQVENILQLPVYIGNVEEVKALVRENIMLSKKEWDSFEESWDFVVHPLVRFGRMNNESSIYGNHSLHISELFDAWAVESNKRFEIMKVNEENINQIFIKMYGLENELEAKETDKEVTVSRADLQRDIRNLISYAVGCMFGRYSLDIEGLIYAGGVWDVSKYTIFSPDPDNCIPITDEPYFEDDIVGRFVEFVRIVYGNDTLEDNLTFIANALGTKGSSSREMIRNYFLSGFYADHVKTYQKRPIYWLFDSGKQNGFKALVYMHRWNADTIGNVRVEYLHRMQKVYEKEIERMQDVIDNSRDNREVAQAAKRREKLIKQLKETQDYDAKIAHAALSRVDIDLDDGVKVNYEKVQKGPDGKSLGILAKI